MPLTYDGDVLRVTAKMKVSTGQDIQNVFHMKHGGSAQEAAVEYAAVADWVEAIYSELITDFASKLTFETIDVYNITKDFVVGEEAWPSLTAGTGTGDPVAPQLSGLITFTTNTGKSQGRKYLPPFFESAATSLGEIWATTLGHMAAAAAAALLDIAIAPDTNISAGNWNQALGRFTTWIAAVVKTTFRTQRRRRTGVGS
jgi:hypothetical protein